MVKEDAAAKALAYFARALGLNPGNRVAASRIVWVLNQHSFPLPLLQCPDGLDERQRAAAYSINFDNKDFAGNWAFILKGKSIIDGRSGRELSRVEFDGQLRRPPSFSRDGEKMAIVTSSNKIEVFLSRSGALALPARYDTNGPFAMFTPEGRSLITGGNQFGDVEVWDLLSQSHTVNRLPHQATVWAMSVSVDGRLLATGVRNGEAHCGTSAQVYQQASPAPARSIFPKLPSVRTGTSYSPNM